MSRSRTLPEDTEKTFPTWYPFLADISRRSKEPVEQLQDQVARGEVQLALIWDGNKARALVGIRILRRGNDLIGEIVWLTGKGMREWQHLLTQMEKYLKEHVGCAEIRPVCRLGWSRFLKTRGYKATHVTMQKVL